MKSLLNLFYFYINAFTEQAALMRDPMYLEELERLQCMEEEAQRLEEEEAKRRKEEWLLRDAALHSKFLNEKQKRELQEEQRMKQEVLCANSFLLCI